MTVRVRYAPSPTGHLHIGSLKISLFNWLFARHYGGVYLLRIEDTDLERSRPEYVSSILESLAWAGLQPDETPVIQSDRAEIHRNEAQKLIDEDKAYKCYCTQEELAERLGASAQAGGYTKYDGHCRTIVSSDKPFAIRFKIQDDVEFVEFNDLIRGVIRVDRDQLDDFIIVRSDGTSMYNFVVVVDDAFMKISHVLRGEDHISNTPKQILLYNSLGYSVPEFAHISVILGPDGQKLSKRHMATSVIDFKKQGYLADALCNYLVRLGWSHGDQEIFTREELIEYFDLDHMSKAGAIFDQQKLAWMNSVYLKEFSTEDICSLIIRDVDPEFYNHITNWSKITLLAMVGLYKERVKTLKELEDELRELHERPREFNVDIHDFKQQSVIDNLERVMQELTRLSDHSHESIDRLLKTICKEKNISLRDIGQPLRVALTGKTSSPGVAQLIALLLVEESIQRIEYFLKHLRRSMKH